MLQRDLSWKNDCLWTLKWGQKSVPQTSTLSKVLPQCQDMWLSRQRTCSRASYSLWFFTTSGPRFGVCRIVFSFCGSQKGVQILGPILGSIWFFFPAAWRRERLFRSMLVRSFAVFTMRFAGAVSMTNSIWDKEEMDGSAKKWMISCVTVKSFFASLSVRDWRSPLPQGPVSVRETHSHNAAML